MPTKLYRDAWHAAAQLALASIRISIALTEGALMVMRAAQKSIELPSGVGEDGTKVPRRPSRARPAASIAEVPLDQSVTPDHVVCLEDGKTFKTLKRHLRAAHGLTEQQYREKWGLADDHPLVAPHYAIRRSAMAKKMGLGKRRERGTERKSKSTLKAA